jgi:putative membrane protein
MPLDQEPRPGSKSATLSALKDSLNGFVAKGLAAVTTSRESFFQMAGMSDLYEMEAANLALTRGSRADVKDFARKMIQDHGQTTEGLRSIAAEKGDAGSLPSSLNSLFQSLVDDLKGVPHDAFDDRYLAQQDAAHSAAITLFKSYRDRGDDEALKQFCARFLPVIEHHARMVKAMKDAE